MQGHISRCQGPKVQGWQVRIPTGQPRQYNSKLFSDSKHGGRQPALLAAFEYLKENVVDRNPAPYRPGKGVSRSHDEHGTPYWAASFTNGPTAATFRPFRESVYGQKLAYELATAYRRAWEKAVDAGETERFFTEIDYPVQANWDTQYCQSFGKTTAHIYRNEDTSWCGRSTQNWEPLGPVLLGDTPFCRHCDEWLQKHLNLCDVLLYYGTITQDLLKAYHI